MAVSDMVLLLASRSMNEEPPWRLFGYGHP
jgi:hypothetical protein